MRRGGRTADLLLHGPLRRCVHHPVSGGVVPGHVFAAEEELRDIKIRGPVGKHRPPCLRNTTSAGEQSKELVYVEC